MLFSPPQAFQFNERYLVSIHEHAHSCQFGTFVGNCQRERTELDLAGRTYSLWGHLVARHDEYANPLYRQETQADVLRVDTSPQCVKFWSGLYCRFESGEQRVFKRYHLCQPTFFYCSGL